MSELGTQVAGIGAYLSTHRLAIPEYQRSYSWSPDGERNEVQDLWDDLRNAIASNEAQYFLGAVVTIPNPQTGRTEVIDGQQRLASVSLLYAAMRDVFAAHPDEQRAQEIETKFLGEKSFASRELTQYLELNADDNDVFRQLTLVRASDRRLNLVLASHGRLNYAFTYFYDRFQELIQRPAQAGWADDLVGWFDFVWNRAEVLEVSVPNEARGFVIFETLNDRGLNLSTADLLKNHLFGKAAGRLPEVKGRWARTVAPFEEPDSTLDLDAFLRHFWASKKGVTRVKGLFNQFKPEIDSPGSAVAFSDQLQEAAALWTAMFDPAAPAWTNYSAGFRAALEALRNLNVEQCRPLLLACLMRLERADHERLLPLLVNWSVRWLVVGGGSAGTTERLYAATAQKVTDGKITEAAGVVAEFVSAVPANLAFIQALETYSTRRSWLARYLLYVLERERRGDPEPELVPNQDVEAVNLEHVLPKSPDPSWGASFSPEEQKVLVFLLGNQALLAKTPNTNIGNRPFQIKKPSLSSSAFLLTQEIGAEADWTPTSIKDRQARLAKLAVTAWPIS
jgi:hypothetical protein